MIFPLGGSNNGAAAPTELDDLTDVTALTPADGEVLQFNATTGQWENVPASAVGATTLDGLSDVTVNATREWAGPYTPLTGVGAPDPGTGDVGDYYVETASFPASLANIKLYGPKAASGTIWPLLGTTGVNLTLIGDANPVGYAHAGSGTHVLRVNFASGTPTIASAWGPYVATGVGERSILTYDQLTGEWADTSWRFVSAVDGGNWAALTASASGGYSILARAATVHAITLTGNVTSSGIGRPRLNVVNPSNDTGSWNARAAVIRVLLIQGGSGGYTYAWPASVIWPGGVAPVLSTAVGAVDTFQLTTWDNGTTWYGVRENGPRILDNLSDATITATQQWPGPFVISGGIGAPGAGTGNVGEFYVDQTNPAIGVLYGPKQSDNSWPLIGNQGTAFTADTTDPVDALSPNVLSNGAYYVKFSFTPPSTVTLLSAWGPLTTAGLSERSYLGYDQATRQWKETNGDFVLNTDGGAAKASTVSVTGNFSFNPNLASYFEHTLTGNANYAAFPTQINTPRFPAGESRAAHLVIALKQGGSGGYTVTWPTAFTWPGGVAPVLSTRVGDVDVFHAVSMDRGVTWNVQQIASGTGPQRVEKVSDKTDDYTFTRADAGNIVTLSGSNNKTFTVPTNANVPLPVGTRITIATVASGHISLVGDSGVTVTGTANLNSAGMVSTVIKVDTNTWISHA